MKVKVSTANSQVSGLPLGFYGAVMLLTMIDNAVLTGVICLSLKLTGSAVPLGCVLCLSAAVPFLLGRLQWLRGAALSFRVLCALRLVAFAFVAIAALCGLIDAMPGFLGMALGVGVADFFTVTLFEAENARLVVGGRMNAWLGARWFQTAVQLGTCAGDMLGGGLLDRLGATNFVTAIGAMGVAANVVLLAVRRLKPTSADALAAHDGKFKPLERKKPPLNIGLNRATALLVCIALFGLHIGAFNSMVPVVFLQLKGWSSAFYGEAAGLVGIGALAAVTLFARPLNWVCVAVLFVACDVLLVMANQMWLVLCSALLLGYLFNYLRVQVRQRLLASAHTDADAEWVGACSAYASLFMQSIGPLTFTLLLGSRWVSVDLSPWMLIGSGILLVAATSFATRDDSMATVLSK